MTSAKMNRAVIESVLKSLSKANYDPSRARPSHVNPGFFASEDDLRDADRAPAQILRMLKSKLPNGAQSSRQDIQYVVEREVWERSFQSVNALIILDLAAGRSPKRHIQEAREAIQAIKDMGDKEGLAALFQRLLSERIGEV